MQKIKILVAMHKAYSLPEENIYAPIQVGGVRIPGMENALRDDTGENISAKNKYYCEMTALYWAWKNLDADCIGLVHYRRYFAGKRFALRKESRIANRSQIEEALEKAPVILPQKRNYWIETTYSQYAHAHHKKDMDLVRSILEERYPEYVRAFDDVMERTAGHRFNMFICWITTVHGSLMFWIVRSGRSTCRSTMNTTSASSVFFRSGCWMCG